MKPLSSSALWLGLAVLPSPSSGEQSRNRTLLPWAFTPLPLGSVRPLGWLRGELQALGSGLAGHEFEFVPYVKDSRWLGGRSDYSALNEALPYWFNGLVPLAYTLDDERLKGQVHTVAAEVLRRQASDGWIGPEVGEDRNLWGRVPFLLGLTQLAEANVTGWKTPVVHSLVKYLRLVDVMLRDGGQGYTLCRWHPNDCSWGQVRVHDFISVIQWMLENTEVGERDKETMWGTMERLYRLSKFKWEDWYTEGRYQKVISDATPGNPEFPYLHGVNVGQGLKASAVIRRFDNRESLVKSTWNAVEWTFKYHGTPSGTIFADEVQRDMAPFMGAELCTAVETGYSLAYLYHALGANSFADRAELTIFNALPVSLTNDAWGHQYMARSNAPWALRQIDRRSLFTTASGMATIFGLEPMYPCCTVNFPQGWPKFIARTWARTETGLVHALLSPSAVNTTIPHRGRVVIECKTDYPFLDSLTYTISAESGFDLFLRFPTWAVRSESTVQVLPGAPESRPESMESVHIDAETGLHRLSIPAGRSRVIYNIASAVRVEPRPYGAVSVYLGNVLYSLDVGQSVTSSLPHRHWNAGGEGTHEFEQFEKCRDFYFNHTKPWNVAIDPSTLRREPWPRSTGFLERGFVDAAAGGPSSFLAVEGCEINWPVLGGAAPAPPPKNPKCVTGKRTFRMIPYGVAKVHMAELPTVKLQGDLIHNSDQGADWGDL
ncbi:hypothetical protein B0T16DRAFT_456694 [Cercophora newfieldiana]|uniref:Uncharacterized protein n=1 Tax=Cercophora newfieldiana TaxID=92897 RepID=A0AA40CU29_9PEZI|nr:hypothetical protein B0T16DRAFT_456694 [Cercophora newfieldiana]